MLREERLADPGRGLGPRQIGPAHETAQAPVANGVTGEQDEMRAPLGATDAAVVLLHGVPVPGQSGSARLGTRREAGPWGWPVGHRCPARSGPSAPGRDHEAVRVRGRGVGQLDLDAEDGAEAGLLGRRRETDHAVQAPVIRHRQAREAQLCRPRDQVRRRRGTVEEREVGVEMELGKRGRWHATARFSTERGDGNAAVAVGGEPHNRTSVRCSQGGTRRTHTTRGLCRAHAPHTGASSERCLAPCEIPSNDPVHGATNRGGATSDHRDEHASHGIAFAPSDAPASHCRARARPRRPPGGPGGSRGAAT